MKKIVGEYFVEYDEESTFWCIFHTDKKPGHVYKSFTSKEEAEWKAEEMNKIELNKCF
jgi:hypothetical protein